MPARKSVAALPGDRTVVEFLAKLEHPHKAGIERLRRLILRTDKRIVEEVKWNAPSFKLVDHFATFRIHPPTNIQLILHTGAKARSNARKVKVDDPGRLLKWPASDRCVLTLASEAELDSHFAEVKQIIRQWVAQLQGPR